ncbi:MAG: sensor histidine kinase [Candidatus Hodarchaeota archaeon]
MSEFLVLEATRTIMFIIGTIIFAFVCLRRRDLISWLPAYIAGSLSELLRLISEVDYDVYYLIGLGFSSLTLVLMIVAVSREYYTAFRKSAKLKVITIFQILDFQIIVSIGLQVIIGILLLVALFLILRVALKKRTPTHAFFCFILICGILNLIALALRDAGLEGAEEFYQFSSIVMATNLLLTGLVALIEQKLVSSETKYRVAFDRAEFYKDLFVHDINNILQNLQFSLEIISQNLEDYNKKEKLEELIMIAKGQVNRGAELGLNVKKLSDLEIGAIKNKPIEVINSLNKVVKDINTIFPDDFVKIDISCDLEKIFVNANTLLEDVLRIIIINGIKYNDNKIKEILIKISREHKDFGSNIRIEFIDNGVGIPDSMKRSLIQPVYKKTKAFKRIGLGLLLVNEVIGSLSGKVWIEDKVIGDYTKGSNINLLIPEARDILDIER